MVLRADPRGRYRRRCRHSASAVRPGALVEKERSAQLFRRLLVLCIQLSYSYFSRQILKRFRQVSTRCTSTASPCSLERPPSVALRSFSIEFSMPLLGCPLDLPAAGREFSHLPREVWAILCKLKLEWPGDSYDILNRNCITFSDEFTKCLGPL